MSIITLDGCLAGMQPPKFIAKAATATTVAGKPISLWPSLGAPGAGAYDSTLNGVTLSSSSTIPAGAIPHVDPGSGNSYLARFSAAASATGTLLLCDRLWHNQLSATVTTSQTIVSPTWPARDNAGSTNGDGVLLGLEFSVATTTNTPTTTVTYTNSAGTGSKTGAFTYSSTAANTIGVFYFITLAAGDTGVRSVQSFQLGGTAWSAGTINLVAYRVLAAMELTTAYVGNALDGLTSGFPQIYNGTVPFLVFIPNGAAATNITGTYVETQG
jgi:hypothetical protein